MAVGDRVSIRMVMMLISHTVKAGPEQKHQEKLSELVSTIQANNFAVLMVVNLVCRKLGLLLPWLIGTPV